VSKPYSCSFGPKSNASFDDIVEQFPAQTDLVDYPIKQQSKDSICAVAKNISSVPPSSTSFDSPTQTYYIRIEPTKSDIAGSSLSTDKTQCLIIVGAEEFSQLTNAEQSFVIAHEKAHCELGHKPLSVTASTTQDQLSEGLAKRRREETRADRLGAKISAKAGVNPDESMKFFYKLRTLENKCHDFFSFLHPNSCAPDERFMDHPTADKRIANYVKELPELRELYQQAVNKLFP